jgi:xanthine dehydrogenase accessory factor
LITGAGHIGKALAHLVNLLDFEVTVIDDRPEFANEMNIPDADHILTGNFDNIIRESAITGNTYIVIVTRGHKNDADALKCCIGSPASYIGMIGSKRKIALMREKFLQHGWATKQQWDRIHAPVGIDINSRTVQEIAVSIAAELIRVRNSKKNEYA